MYVAVKGGEQAIEAAHRLLAEDRRGDPKVPAVTVEQIAEQLTLAVDRVMAEGSLYDPALAALAVKQARGDLIEAIFLIRAARTTLPRFGYAAPLDTASDGGAPAGFGDLQGYSRRPDPRSRPSTIRTGCSTSRWPATARPSRRQRLPKRSTLCCRGCCRCSARRG